MKSISILLFICICISYAHGTLDEASPEGDAIQSVDANLVENSAGKPETLNDAENPDHDDDQVGAEDSDSTAAQDTVGSEIPLLEDDVRGEEDEYFESSVDADVVSPEMDVGAGNLSISTNSSGGPENEGKKIPLREILRRLKPASLMDDDERAAAERAGQLQDGGSAGGQGAKSSDSSTPGTVVDGSLVIGGGGGGGGGKRRSGNSTAACAPTPTPDGIQLLNASALQDLVSPNPNVSYRATAAPCALVFFYSEHCPFSVAAAPAVTAMARHLNGVMPVYGVDSIAQHSINAQYGVMGTPTLLLFHNGHIVTQYNASSYSGSLLTAFLHHFTDYRPQQGFVVADEDYKESVLPLKVVPYSGWWLGASWIFLLSVASSCFFRSSLWGRITEAFLNNWREAEAHHHQD